MIGSKVLGIPMHQQRNRRWFVACYWLAVAASLAALARFPMPPDVSRWKTFLPLLLTLAVASNLPLLLGGFSVGGAVSFYEGERSRRLNADPGALRKMWTWAWGKHWSRVAATPEGMLRVRRLAHAVRPADERETRLRDEAHHVAHRVQLWMIYAGTVAYLVVSAIDLQLLARYGFLLLELLLVASLSVPQCCILWTTPDVEPGDVTQNSPETQCEQN